MENFKRKGGVKVRQLCKGYATEDNGKDIIHLPECPCGGGLHGETYIDEEEEVVE